MELVPSSANMRGSVVDESDTDFSLISSLTSEQHLPSASLASRTRASLLVSTAMPTLVAIFGCFDAVGWAAGRASGLQKYEGMVEVGTG